MCPLPAFTPDAGLFITISVEEKTKNILLGRKMNKRALEQELLGDQQGVPRLGDDGLFFKTFFILFTFENVTFNHFC